MVLHFGLKPQKHCPTLTGATFVIDEQSHTCQLWTAGGNLAAHTTLERLAFWMIEKEAFAAAMCADKAQPCKNCGMSSDACIAAKASGKYGCCPECDHGNK